MINGPALAKMKPTAILINAAGGGILDESTIPASPVKLRVGP